MDYIKLFEAWCFILTMMIGAIFLMFIGMTFATIMFEIVPDKLQKLYEKIELKRLEKNRHENDI